MSVLANECRISVEHCLVSKAKAECVTRALPQRTSTNGRSTVTPPIATCTHAQQFIVLTVRQARKPMQHILDNHTQGLPLRTCLVRPHHHAHSLSTTPSHHTSMHRMTRHKRIFLYGHTYMHTHIQSLCKDYSSRSGVLRLHPTRCTLTTRQPVHNHTVDAVMTHVHETQEDI